MVFNYRYMVMNTLKRNILFLTVCLPLRTLVVYLLSRLNLKQRKYISWIFLIPAYGWLNLTIVGKKKGFFKGNAWWSGLRPIHSLLYFIFVILSIREVSTSYYFLYLDVLVGLSGFIYYKLLI